MQEVVAEMKKVTWPTRPELLQATLVVIVAVAIMAAFLGLADQVSQQITDWIFPTT
jgi:preprotein translocase subunit SecE